MNSLLLNRLRRTLLKCSCFSSDENLKAIFTDSRLRPWQNIVPEASTPQQRVNYFIRKFENIWDDTKQNALWIFLYAICDSKGTIGQSPTKVKSLATDFIIETIQAQINDCEKELKEIRDFEEQNQDATSGNYITRRKKELIDELEEWQEKLNHHFPNVISQEKPKLSSCIAIKKTNNQKHKDIFSDIPKDKYLEYVSRTLLAGIKSNYSENFDPFVTEIPDYRQKFAYVHRLGVTERAFNSRIIVAGLGSGKSSLAQFASNPSSIDKRLTVTCHN